MNFRPLDELIVYTSRLLREKVGRPVAEVKHVVAPYRICPLGAHVDHQGGNVLGRTIDAYSVLAFTPINQAEIRVYSANYPNLVTLSLANVGSAQLKDWCRYARGAAHVLRQHYGLRKGFCGFVYGTLPGGGLSSSASVGLAYLCALAVANDVVLSRPDLIELDRQLENDYLGLQNGTLDQATIVHGRRDALLHINIRDQEVAPILDPPQAHNNVFLIAYSGFSRELTVTGYNDRVTECRQAAIFLGRQAGQPDVSRLAEIPAGIFETFKHTLPANLGRRATHFFREVDRVEQGGIAWKQGDMERFGELMNASCRSSIYQYECGNQALTQLQEIVSAAPGMADSRFSGGGYGGCVVGLVEMAAASEAIAFIKRGYEAAFPDVGGQATYYLARSEDGLRLA